MTAPVFATPGDFDSNFGGGSGRGQGTGYNSLQLDTDPYKNFYPVDIHVQADEKPVLSGRCQWQSKNGGGLIRWTSAGALDTNSSTGFSASSGDTTPGWYCSPQYGWNSQAEMGLFDFDANENITTAMGFSSYDFPKIYQYDEDNNVNFSGYFEGSYWPEMPSLVKTLPGGDILIVSAVPVPTNKRWLAIYRVNSNGTMDTSFGGGDGIVYHEIDVGKYVLVKDAFIEGNKLAITMTATSTRVSNTPGGYYALLGMFNVDDGSFDTSFSSDGQLGLESGTDTYKVILDWLKRPIVEEINSATSGNAKYDFKRFETDGDLDTSFGSSGTETIDVSANNDYLKSFVPIPNGGFATIGESPLSGTTSYAVTVHERDGDLDTDFSSDGIKVQHLGQSGVNDHPIDIAVAPNDKLVVTGNTDYTFPSETLVTVARLESVVTPAVNAAITNNIIDWFSEDTPTTFDFAADGPIDHYECRISTNGVPNSWFECGDTEDNFYTVQQWSMGYHTFEVRAVDLNGAAGPSDIEGFSVYERELFYGARNENGNYIWVGDPVNTFSGNVSFNVQDFLIKGRGLSTQFMRTYNAQEASLGPLGYGWTHIYNISLTEKLNDDVEVRDYDGRLSVFTHETNDTYTAPDDNPDQLVKNLEGSFTLTRKNQVIWEFNSSGQLTEIEDANGNVIAFDYTSNKLTKITDPVGRETDITYDGSKIDEIEDPLGRIYDYDYDNSELVSYTDPTGAETLYEYDNEHKLTKITKPGTLSKPGAETTYSYDSSDRATEVNSTDGVGELTFDYQISQGRTKVTDSKDRVGYFYYDFAGHITKVTDPNNEDELSTWNTDGTRASSTDQLGRVTNYDYDSDGNLISVLEPKPLVSSPSRPETTFEYDSVFNLPTKITDAEGGEKVFDYDSDGNLISEINERGKETTYTYNSHGQPLTITDPKEEVTELEYNNDGTIDKIIDRLNHETTFTYDDAGRILSSTDDLGRTTDFDWDDLDRLLETTLPAPVINGTRPTISQAYDKRGNLLSVTNERGKTSTFEYDPNNRLIEATNPLSNTVLYEYDDENNLIETTYPEGETVQVDYDDINRPIKTTVDDGTLDGIESEATYNEVGQMTSITDPKGHVTDYLYDAQNNLIQVTDAEEGETNYEYDYLGRLVSLTNANSHETTYSYDDASNILSKVDPLSNEWTYTYDDNGNLATTTDAENQTTTLTYDAEDRLTDLDATGISEEFTYDEVNNLTQVVDATGTTSFTYDRLGRLTNKNLPGARDLSYEYDLGSNITALNLPDSKTVGYSYDDAGNLLTVEDPESNVTNYSYDDNSRLTEVAYPGTDNGEAYTYDDAGRIAEVVNKANGGSVLSSRDYTYDKASNPTQIEDENSNTSTFTYDDIDRLLEEVHTGPGATTKTYTYDDAGNRASLVEGLDTTNYTYNNAEQLTAAGGATYTNDDNGNPLTKAENNLTTNYTYDPKGRLTEVDQPGSTPDEVYLYNAADQRTKETVGTDVTDFIYDGGVVVEEKTSSQTKQYTRGLAGRIISSQTVEMTPQISYFYHDAQGSVLNVASAAGTESNAYLYNAFGDIRDETGSTPQPWGYLENRTNPATKLNNFHARSYDVANGRFYGPDPIAGVQSNPQSLNPYAYSFNNPLRYMDPLGTVPVLVQNPSGPVHLGPDFDGVAVLETALSIVNPGYAFGMAIRGDDCGKIDALETAFAVGSALPPGKALKVAGLAAGGIAKETGEEVAEAGLRAAGKAEEKVYWRKGNEDTQTMGTAVEQFTSGQLWGKEPRNTMSSSIKKVKGYDGEMPEGAPPGSIQFKTSVPPDKGGAPGSPTWSGTREGVWEDGDFAKIKCTVTHICMPPP